MKKLIFLFIISIFFTSFKVQSDQDTYWVFCATTGKCCYVSDLVQFKIGDNDKLLQTWKLRIREEVGDSYKESDYYFRIVDRDCSIGNVAYSSQYAASQGRDCYARQLREKGVNVKKLSLIY